jgi:hypothetical protein
MRKTLVIFLMLGAFLLCISGIAMAVDINLSIDNGGTTIYKLVNMSIAQDGTITLNVSSTTPPPGALSLSLNPTSLPTGTINTLYGPKLITMTASGGSAPYTYNCSLGSCVAGISASPSGNTCTVGGTPTTSGNCTVNFSVTDATPTTKSSSIIFQVGSSTPSAIDIGQDFYTVYPNVKTDTISANGVKYYYFKLNKTVSNLGIVIASLDWTTDQDCIVSKKQQPTMDIYNQVRNSGTNSRDPSATYWYNFNKGTLEQLELTNVGGNAGDIFYVTVFNVSNQQGRYQIYWYPY